MYTHIIPSPDVGAELDEPLHEGGPVVLHREHERGHAGRLKQNTGLLEK